jgi:hypothetical protein
MLKTWVENFISQILMIQAAAELHTISKMSVRAEAQLFQKIV